MSQLVRPGGTLADVMKHAIFTRLVSSVKLTSNGSFTYIDAHPKAFGYDLRLQDNEFRLGSHVGAQKLWRTARNWRKRLLKVTSESYLEHAENIIKADHEGIWDRAPHKWETLFASDQYKEYMKERIRLPHFEDIYTELKPDVDPVQFHHMYYAQGLYHLRFGHLRDYIRALRAWNPAFSPGSPPRVHSSEKVPLPRHLKQAMVDRMYYYPSTLQLAQSILTDGDRGILLAREDAPDIHLLRDVIKHDHRFETQIGEPAELAKGILPPASRLGLAWLDYTDTDPKHRRDALAVLDQAGRWLNGVYAVCYPICSSHRGVDTDAFFHLRQHGFRTIIGGELRIPDSLRSYYELETDTCGIGFAIANPPLGFKEEMDVMLKSITHLMIHPNQLPKPELDFMVQKSKVNVAGLSGELKVEEEDDILIEKDDDDELAFEAEDATKDDDDDDDDIEVNGAKENAVKVKNVNEDGVEEAGVKADVVAEEDADEDGIDNDGINNDDDDDDAEDFDGLDDTNEYIPAELYPTPHVFYLFGDPLNDSHVLNRTKFDSIYAPKRLDLIQQEEANRLFAVRALAAKNILIDRFDQPKRRMRPRILPSPSADREARRAKKQTPMGSPGTLGMPVFEFQRLMKVIRDRQARASGESSSTAILAARAAAAAAAAATATTKTRVTNSHKSKWTPL